MTALRHNEMIVRSDPRGIFKNAIPGVKVYVRVRCTGQLHNGNPCNKLLARVDVDNWERDMASKALLSCEKCGKEYTLAEYR